jgi:hypothetical protein
MSVNKNVSVCVATSPTLPVEIATPAQSHRPPQPSANIIRPVFGAD